MKLSIERSGPPADRRLQDDLKQERFALMQAMNGTGFEIRKGEQAAMRASFDRVTPYMVNSVIVRTATRDNLVVEVLVDDFGRRKGVVPAKVAQAEVFGGQRRQKRAEIAFQRIGLLPPGWAMVPSTATLGDSKKTDAYGNVKGAFFVRLLSYFKAFGEQGYRANMTDKRRGQLARRGRTKTGFATIRGVEYFVSRGPGSWGTNHRNRSGQLSRPEGQLQRLHAGIWARSGVHGSVLKPVFFFVPMPAYRPRFHFFTVANTIEQRTFPARHAAARAAASRTAR